MYIHSLPLSIFETIKNPKIGTPVDSKYLPDLIGQYHDMWFIVEKKLCPDKTSILMVINSTTQIIYVDSINLFAR